MSKRLKSVSFMISWFKSQRRFANVHNSLTRVTHCPRCHARVSFLIISLWKLNVARKSLRAGFETLQKQFIRKVIAGQLRRTHRLRVMKHEVTQLHLIQDNTELWGQAVKVTLIVTPEEDMGRWHHHVRLRIITLYCWDDNTKWWQLTKKIYYRKCNSFE